MYISYLIIVNDIEDCQKLQLKIGNDKEIFDLSSLVTLNKEIVVNCAALAAPLTIVKQGVIVAEGKFNYQNGVQWITFTYEGKKQNGNLALSLIDCIKIKVKCVNGVANSTKSSKRQITAKTSIRNKMLGIISPVQKVKKITNQSHNRSYEEEIDFGNYFKEIDRELTTTNKNSKILTSSVILNRNLHTPVNKVKNAKFTSISFVNHNKKNPSISSIKNKRDKTPLITNENKKRTTKLTAKKLKSYNAHTNESKLDNNKTFEGKEIIRKLEPNFTKAKINETNINKKETFSDNNISIHEETKIAKQTANSIK